MFNGKSLDRNDDVEMPVVVVVDMGRLGKVLLSSDEWPSSEPLVINEVEEFIGRSVSEIVRESNGDG